MAQLSSVPSRYRRCAASCDCFLHPFSWCSSSSCLPSSDSSICRDHSPSLQLCPSNVLLRPTILNRPRRLLHTLAQSTTTISIKTLCTAQQTPSTATRTSTFSPALAPPYTTIWSPTLLRQRRGRKHWFVSPIMLRHRLLTESSQDADRAKITAGTPKFETQNPG